MLGACLEHCFASYRSSDRSLASRSTDCITLPARSPTGQVDRRKASEPVHAGMARCGARWIANQVTEACGWEQAPPYLIRDRDGAYGEVFIRRLRSMGIRDRPTCPLS